MPSLRAHPLAQPAAQVVDALDQRQDLQDGGLLGRAMAEVSLQGCFDLVLASDERALEPGEVGASPFEGWRAVAQEGLALALEVAGEGGCRVHASASLGKRDRPRIRERPRQLKTRAWPGWCISFGSG